MFKKMILIFMFTVFLYNPYSNCKSQVLFENFSEFRIKMIFLLERYDFSKGRFRLCRNGSNKLRKEDVLVVGFMREPLHCLFYKNMSFFIENQFYKWGPFYLSSFDLDYDYKIYTNQKDLWFMGYNSDYVFVTDTVNGVLRKHST